MQDVEIPLGKIRYRLSVTMTRDNPKYSPCGAGTRAYGPEEPQFTEERSLEVVLTEAEFQAVKKAVVEVM